jgi:hypothetical protein
MLDGRSRFGFRSPGFCEKDQMGRRRLKGKKVNKRGVGFEDRTSIDIKTGEGAGASGFGGRKRRF